MKSLCFFPFFLIGNLCMQVLSDDAVDDLDKAQYKIPLLVYVSREKRRSHHHHFKAGALNVLVWVSYS